MNATRSMRTLLAACLLATIAPALAGDDPADAMAAFFKRMQATTTPFEEFRFLSGPEVEANPVWKQLAAQTLAASLAKPLPGLDHVMAPAAQNQSCE